MALECARTARKPNRGWVRTLFKRWSASCRRTSKYPTRTQGPLCPLHIRKSRPYNLLAQQVLSARYRASAPYVQFARSLRLERNIHAENTKRAQDPTRADICGKAVERRIQAAAKGTRVCWPSYGCQVQVCG